MSAPQVIMFGRCNGTQGLQAGTFRGMPGFYNVPTSWFTRTNPSNPAELIVSPNEDFSSPTFNAWLGDDSQNYVFQWNYLSALQGQDGNNQQ